MGTIGIFGYVCMALSVVGCGASPGVATVIDGGPASRLESPFGTLPPAIDRAEDSGERRPPVEHVAPHAREPVPPPDAGEASAVPTLLALGDSITHGYGDGPPPDGTAAPLYDGYRPTLLADVTAAGFPVRFVGGQVSGTVEETSHHEGVNGATVADKLADVARIAAFAPDVFLVDLGTNDHAREFAANYPVLLRELHATVPRAEFVVAALGHGAIDLPSNNTALPKLWDELESEGLRLHRSYPGSPPMVYPEEYNRDGVHPNAAGYVHMGHLLATGVIEALAATSG